jgi:outer membrane protein TolC
LEDRERVRLNIIQEAVTAYLNVLRTKTLYRIQRANLKVTQSNLELAQARVSIGATGRQEVLRWETEIASAKIAVLQADALRNQAAIALNRILDKPLEERFTTAEADLSDPALLTSDERLFRYTGNPLLFEVFRDFMVQRGLASSPELRGLDAALAAQERLLTSTHNAFWAPAVSLLGDATYTFHRSGAGTVDSSPALPFQIAPPDDLNWAVAVQLSLPIFTSGERFGQVARARETVGQLQTERAAVAQRIELAIRSSLQTTSASFGSIRLSAEGADAALENLDLVTDAYSRGAVDIIQLLDAQNSARNATLAADNAVYDFLIDFMNVQRSIGSFDIFLSADQREEWFEQLGDFYRERGIILTNP